jgi:hypothetical protein
LTGRSAVLAVKPATANPLDQKPKLSQIALCGRLPIQAWSD